MGSLLTLYLVFLGSFLTHATAERCDLRTSLLDRSNAWNVNTTIYFPTDEPSFFEVTERWNPYNAPTFSAAITPATEDDVVKAVRLARRCNFPFLATGGRHGYGSTMKRLQGGLEISLRQLNSVSINKEAATVTVGGGTRVNELLDPVSDAGFEMPLGGCSCPGIVGITLGAGVNHWQGIHGLVLDALRSVRIVTADGSLVEASETQNPDLFWGLRGAGSNFGIVTFATYHLYEQTNNDEILIVDVIFPATANEEYHTALGSIMAEQPADMSLFSNMIWDPINNSPIFVGDFIYFGSREKGLELLAPILELGPKETRVNVVSWRNFYDTVLLETNSLNCQDGIVRTPYNALTKNISVPTMVRGYDMMIEFLESHPYARASSMTFERHPPILARPMSFEQSSNIGPDDSTAYAWRETQGQLVMFMSFPLGDSFAAAQAHEIGRTIRNEFSSVSGFGDGSDLAVYINAAQGDEPLESVYGAHNLPRLVALKQTWDPDNVFGYHFGLPTQYP
ncbi:hypothetical protein B0I35DRAFT_444309 [Stachybotrys elegans]|uniref:FAD-binding PCMH-type domain-containing protein n=1 Tax=Stachybotrys elegans TaxID=80388 RepID=A0A8K0SJ81_9HYPO|nr:hypothetical protein B0I35DRAFT_444309 [Stachybotrys elegans]